jgi:(1->4)-alpha-D-glucan 1-alpha-D-glucosylmutase
LTVTRIPLSTYRLQFNHRFTFCDARRIVDYLAALGVTDCYASSYLMAMPGSPHGYDVADPTRLNPEVGSDEEYWAWVAALRKHSMGHVLDVVPNHMGIARSNPWWLDVLENGPSSRYARFFDISWHPVKDELANKLLIPILGDQYGAVLERQELKLVFERGAFFVKYYDDVLPVAPDTYVLIFRNALDDWVAHHPGDAADELRIILAASQNLPPRSSTDPVDVAVRARDKDVIKRRLAAVVEGSAEVRALVDACVEQFNGIAGQPRSFDRLDRLLNEQSYRLAHWRVASQEINYRRFFDVNQLAALRMEDPEVFDEVHRFVFDLVRKGGPTGLRIDHVDGLYSPGDYLTRLQANLRRATSGDTKEAEAAASGAQGPAPAHSVNSFYIVVEKILSGDERIPDDWPVHGTTGYEFASVVNNLFVDGRNKQALDAIYARFVRGQPERLSFADLAYRSRKQIMHETMSGDINSLGYQLNRFSERNRHFRDFTLYNLIATLKEVLACFPVYRTYVTAGQPASDHDRRYIRQAVECAKRRAPAVTPLVFDFIERLLLQETPLESPEACEERSRFVGKFQQTTSPVAAKGIEDTAFYLFNRLLSLNEVGSDPTRFGLEPGQVHDWLRERQRRWPSALSATATHDTKRGEDMRARLNVLSEIPGAWKDAVAKWRTLNRRFKSEVRGAPVPDANEEYFLYQTLVGAWPFHRSDETHDRFRDRIVEYMRKALRESKAHTSWLSPDEAYEAAVLRFVEAILDRRRPNPFLQAFLQFQSRVADLGIYNSLAQLVVKITAPGVPDFYQGTEFWDLSLVDPDNRRPVDYEHRRAVLRSLASCLTPDLQCAAELLDHRADGRVKMFVTTRALGARRRWRSVYEQGDYVPLPIAGGRRDCLFAFARVGRTTSHGSSNRAITITCVPRLIGSLISDVATPPLGQAVWGDTRIELPRSLAHPEEASSLSFRDVFTGAAVQPDSTGDALTIPATTLLESFPVALLVPANPHEPDEANRGQDADRSDLPDAPDPRGRPDRGDPR